uniref:Chromosome 10 open reading frame 143 n=1 Tax=Steinernema glaseri TaxID=37863 RepID=A0A1I8A716_9BILA
MARREQLWVWKSHVLRIPGPAFSKALDVGSRPDALHPPSPSGAQDAPRRGEDVQPQPGRPGEEEWPRSLNKSFS